ncbi:hypothetical protein KKH23_00650 [Patescibacteria group bacterium]|nr:hypothetical protein [Patescibacteria group bacterium]MBU1066617.1 hypothetical protein [Patescibacteria group bacterium]
MKKKYLLTLLVVFLLALPLGSAFANGGGITHVVSSPLNYSGTGWGGWSCPTGLVVVNAGVQGNIYPVGESVVWKPGASTAGGVNYPNTPFGYTYTPPEEGYIVQNGGKAQTLQIWLDCAPPSVPTSGGPEATVVFSAWLGTADDGSWCALASPVGYVGVEVQAALCFPKTNPEWVATNVPCYGPVYDNNTWVCDHLIGGSGNRLDVDAWRANIHNFTP